MALKDILVHVGYDRRASARLNAAVELAEAHGAHLTGVHAMEQPMLSPFVEASAGADVLEGLLETMRRHAAECQARFAERLGRAGIGYDWLQLEGQSERMLALAARHYDLLVMGQYEADDADSQPGLADALILSAGRPVLVLPYAGTPRPLDGEVLVAWNGSRESARAVADAMPFLTRAKGVTVFATNPEDRAERIPGADIARHLARHDVKVTAAHTVANDIDVADVLLSSVADRGIDLLVMGGWGHSRMRELVLGGVTRHILKSMTVPVLFSH